MKFESLTPALSPGRGGRAPYLIILVLALLVLAQFVLPPTNSVSKQELKKMAKKYQHREDSLVRLWRVQSSLTIHWRDRAQRAEEGVRVAEMERNNARAQARQAIKEYESIVLRRYRAEQYDSVLGRLYPGPHRPHP